MSTNLSMFRREILPPSSGSKDQLSKKLARVGLQAELKYWWTSKLLDTSQNIILVIIITVTTSNPMSIGATGEVHLKKMNVFLSLVHVFMMSLFVWSVTSTVFWDLTLKVTGRFTGTYCLNCDSQKESQARTQLASSFACCLLHAICLLGLLQPSYKIIFFPGNCIPPSDTYRVYKWLSFHKERMLL